MRSHITGGFELLLCRRGLSGVGRVADLVVELTNTERILLSDEILEGMEGEGGTTVDRPSSVLWAGMITTELMTIINKLRSNFLLLRSCDSCMSTTVPFLGSSGQEKNFSCRLNLSEFPEVSA